MPRHAQAPRFSRGLRRGFGNAGGVQTAVAQQADFWQARTHATDGHAHGCVLETRRRNGETLSIIRTDSPTASFMFLWKKLQVTQPIRAGISISLRLRDRRTWSLEQTEVSFTNPADADRADAFAAITGRLPAGADADNFFQAMRQHQFFLVSFGRQAAQDFWVLNLVGAEPAVGEFLHCVESMGDIRQAPARNNQNKRAEQRASCRSLLCGPAGEDLPSVARGFPRVRESR